MAHKEIVYVKVATPGSTAGGIACLFSVLGIFTLGVVFVPLAAVIALVGSVMAIMHLNIAGMAMNALAWFLVIIGILTSPVLLAFFFAILSALHIQYT